METLYENIRIEDKKDRKKILYFALIISCFTLVYFSSFNANHGLLRQGFGFLVLSFIMIVGYFFRKYMMSRKINYSEPVVEFLRKAEKRYSYLPLSELVFIIPLLMMIISSGAFVVYSSFSKYMDNPFPAVLIYFGVMVTVVTIGLWAGKKQWVKEKSHLYLSIRKMLEEFRTGDV